MAGIMRAQLLGMMINDDSNERPIQRLLRRMNSQDYFTGNGWTMEIARAKSFTDSMELIRTCSQFDLSNVEMVLRIRGGTADLFCTQLR